MRAKWKYFYCDFKLMKQFLIKKKKNIYNYSRKSTILPIFLNKFLFIHNGISFRKIFVTNFHLFHKFGEFSFSKKIAIHYKKNKNKNKK